MFNEVKIPNQPTNFRSTQQIKFNKTETEYNMKSIKFLLLTITTMFIIIAALLIVMGISVYSHYHSFSFFYESAKTGRFFTPSVLSIFLGLIILVVTSFGFFGTLKSSTCMVNLYAVILILILIVKLVVVILAFTTDSRTIMKYIDIPIWQYTDEPEIQGEIDELQIALNCCGSSSYMDYEGIFFTSNHSTVIVPAEVNGELRAIEVPETCCAVSSDSICTRLRHMGCKEALANVIVQNASILGVLGVSVMFIQLLGIIFALLLARCIRKFKSEKAFLAWKEKEQVIMARQEKYAQEQNEPDSVYIVPQESTVA